MNPSETTDLYWLNHRSESVTENYPNEFMANPGKWMIFYPMNKLDEAWSKAKELYDSGGLYGIHSMKVSTRMENPRASSSDSGVIIFYCGPAHDKSFVMTAGENLVKAMEYVHTSRKYPPFIYYKTDQQTRLGTRATGCKRNSTYSLSVPVEEEPKNWRRNEGEQKDWRRKEVESKDWRRKEMESKDWKRKEGEQKDWRRKEGESKDWQIREGEQQNWRRKEGDKVDSHGNQMRPMVPEGE